MLQTGLLRRFLVYLVSINFVPRFNKFSIYHFYCYFYLQRHWYSYNEPFVSFYNILFQNTAYLYGFIVLSCEPGLLGVEHVQCCVSGTYNLSAAHSFWTQLYSIFPLLSAPHSLFGIWTNLKRSENIQGAPTRRWEWIWLTGPSGLYRNSPQRLNISSIEGFWPDERSGIPSQTI